jgi:hypothetical protein
MKELAARNSVTAQSPSLSLGPCLEKLKKIILFISEYSIRV